MNLIKAKLKNGIWYNGFLWKMRDVISPNKFQDFIIIEREVETVEEDGTVSVELFLLDADNDLFYPNVPAVSKIMKRRQIEDKNRRKEEYWDSLKEGALSNIARSMFNDNEE